MVIEVQLFDTSHCSDRPIDRLSVLNVTQYHVN